MAKHDNAVNLKQFITRKNVCAHFVLQLNFYCGYKTASLCYYKQWILLYPLAFPTDLFVCLLIVFGMIRLFSPLGSSNCCPGMSRIAVCKLFPLSLLTGSIRLISDLFNKRNSLGFHCNMIFLWQLGRFFGGILLPLISSRWLMGNFRLSSEVGKHLYIVTTLIHLNMREGRLFLSQLRIYYSIVAFFNVQRSWRRVMLQPLVCKTCEPTKARHDNVNVMFSLLQWYCL